MTRIKLNKSKVDHVIDTVCQESGVSREILMSKDKHNSTATARFIAYYILHEHLGVSYRHTGILLGRTHRSVMWGIDVVKSWSPSNRFRDKATKENYELLQCVISKLKL